MIKVLKAIAEKYFSDEEAIILLLMLVLATFVVVVLGGILAPIIAAVIIAFILQGLVTRLVSFGLPVKLAVVVVFLLFVGLLMGFTLGLLPLLWTQLTSLVGELPRMFSATQDAIQRLPFQYPHLISVQTINDLFTQLTSEVGHMTQRVLSFSLRSIPNLVAWLIYLVLVPILVFFLLKDKVVILNGLARLLPRERPMMQRIWQEMNLQFANYVRGKALELVVVGGATYIAFKAMGLHYSALLSMLVGLSVVIPYIGVAVVTIPVAMIALFQFGLSSHFIWLMVIYAVIQAIDGNVFVPLFFSEVNNLHPVLIILAVLFFGGIWGIWGVFFAIPLATLLKAVLSAWPVHTAENSS